MVRRSWRLRARARARARGITGLACCVTGPMVMQRDGSLYNGMARYITGWPVA